MAGGERRRDSASHDVDRRALLAGAALGLGGLAGFALGGSASAQIASGRAASPRVEALLAQMTIEEKCG